LNFGYLYPRNSGSAKLDNVGPAPPHHFSAIFRGKNAQNFSFADNVWIKHAVNKSGQGFGSEMAFAKPLLCQLSYPGICAGGWNRTSNQRFYDNQPQSAR
jgi:hypothetical protein